jgi:hypothetical protein
MINRRAQKVWFTSTPDPPDVVIELCSDLNFLPTPDVVIELCSDLDPLPTSDVGIELCSDLDPTHA